MNVALLTRALRRHHHMKDREAYEALLREARSHGDCWMAPQAEIAAWWTSRQRAVISMRAEAHALYLDAGDLEGAVLEVDGELALPPVRLEGRASASVPLLRIERQLLARHRDVAQELLAHLGYGHVRWESADDSEAGLADLLERLAQTLSKHQRYESTDLGSFRTLLAEAHGRAGLPDCRIWTLPHRSGRPYRVALSPRYDVDKAIVNLPMIHELEAEYGVRSTVYLRPMGLFYGRGEIESYARQCSDHEIALHAEFVTTAGMEFGDEFSAAKGEKQRLEEFSGRKVRGVCMHGGELRTNTTANSKAAIDGAGYLYETLYRNRYYLPLHAMNGDAVSSTVSIGQHFADISVEPDADFSEQLAQRFMDHFARASEQAGIFVPVMHPLYFGLGNYLRHPINSVRFALFVPRFLWLLTRVPRNRSYANAEVSRA